MIKVNSLNPFDKGFFGKTMAAAQMMNRSRGEMLYPSKLSLDSIDDFNKHFDMMKLNSKFEKSPVKDTFSTLPDQMLNIF